MPSAEEEQKETEVPWKAEYRCLNNQVRVPLRVSFKGLYKGCYLGVF